MLAKLGRYDETLAVYDSLLIHLDNSAGITPKKRSKLFNSLSSLYRQLEDYQQAKAYGLKALHTKREIKDVFGQVVSLGTLSSISKEAKDIDGAVTYGLEALRLADSLGRIQLIVPISINLGNLYTVLLEYELAETYLERGIQLAEANKMTRSLGISYMNLAGVYEVKKELSKASRTLDKAVPYLESSSSLEFQRDYHRSRANIAKSLGQYAEAYTHLTQMHLFQDSMFSAEKTKTIAELEARYELSTKENEIALLTKDAELQEVSNAKLKQQQGLLLGGGLALLIFTGLLINRYRSKQRTLQTISRQNEEITARSRENELLVREIHHRVKNNMAIMQGLLQAQRERHTHNNELEEALLVCEGQLSSMALIHQDLYRTNNFMAVDAEDYFTKLLQNIQSAYAERSRAIAFKVQLSKQELQVHQAVPLGLIMNELVTNAVKYAFPERQPGAEIRINQEAVGEELVLSVRDNGVGIAASRRQRVSSGFGLSMVKGLTRQLGGRLRQEECDGTCFEVAIPLASFVASDVERRPAAAGQAVASA